MQLSFLRGNVDTKTTTTKNVLKKYRKKEFEMCSHFRKDKVIFWSNKGDTLTVMEGLISFFSIWPQI